ncbi:MAG: hypothetical protein JKY65_17850 [Planctomycetes bacterium]|nr:hypothetical protein [Planctomycetota bacterium]
MPKTHPLLLIVLSVGSLAQAQDLGLETQDPNELVQALLERSAPPPDCAQICSTTIVPPADPGTMALRLLNLKHTDVLYRLADLPKSARVHDRLKALYDSPPQNFDKEDRDRLGTWLSFNTRHLRAELIRAAPSFHEVDGYVSDTGAIGALIELDWGRAQPILVARGARGRAREPAFALKALFEELCERSLPTQAVRKQLRARSKSSPEGSSNSTRRRERTSSTTSPSAERQLPALTSGWGVFCARSCGPIGGPSR